MDGYFRPRRRKVGIITLMAICVFMLIWARSWSTLDFIHFKTNQRTRYCVESICGKLRLDRQYETIAGRLPPLGSSYGWESDPVFKLNDETAANFKELQAGVDKEFDEHRKWRCQFFGLDTGAEEDPLSGFSTFFVSIPALFFVIPLALLTAWLLLSKPKVTPPTAALSPIETP